MLNSKNIVAVVIIIVVSALLIGVFIYFGGSNSSIESDLQVPPSDFGGKQVLSRELLSALSSIKDLELKEGFFKDRAFESLNDYSKDLKDEKLGRDNPFLPVESAPSIVVGVPTP